MKRTIIVGANENPDYYFYAPFIEHAWNKLGWNLCFMISDNVEDGQIHTNNPETIFYRLPKIEGVRTATMGQVGRLYAANYIEGNPLLMTADIDIVPLSNYWTPDPAKMTVYGYDLTGYTQYPMVYIAMCADRWRSILSLTGNTKEDMERDFKETGKAYSEKWEVWWDTDQELITRKMIPFASEIAFYNRGQRPKSPYAAGRIDRGDGMKWIEGQLIDAHCENHNVRAEHKINTFLSMFERVWGEIPQYK